MKLSKLTKEHEQILAKTKEDWLSLAFVRNKEGINKPLFEEGITWLYEDLLTKEKPKIVYCDSWLSCLIEIHKYKTEYDNRGLNLKPVNSISQDRIRAAIGSPARSKIESLVGESVITIVNALKGEIGGRVDDSVWKVVWLASTSASFNAELDFSPNEFADSAFIGWDNFGVTAFYDFFERIGILDDYNFKQYRKLNQSNCFTLYEYSDVVFAIQPPVVIERNENGILHSTERPSIEYKDGFCHYFINRIEMPDWIFKGFNKAEFLEVTDKDISAGMRAIVESKGEDFMLKFLRGEWIS